jgi:hypothetical protein
MLEKSLSCFSATGLKKFRSDRVKLVYNHRKDLLEFAVFQLVTVYTLSGHVSIPVGSLEIFQHYLRNRFGAHRLPGALSPEAKRTDHALALSTEF